MRGEAMLGSLIDSKGRLLFGPLMRMSAASIAVVVLLTACGNGGSVDTTVGGMAADSTSTTEKAGSDSVETTSTSAQVEDGNLASDLPEPLVGDGVLQVATSGAFPPMNFIDDDGETVIGASVDVITLMAEELGLETEMIVTDFAGILTGIQAERFDAGVVFADTPERNAIVDILDVFETGHRFLTTPGYEGPDTPPCGSTIAVAAGSNEIAVLDELSEENCESQGEPAYSADEYPSNDNAALALASDRAEFFITSAENAAFREAEEPAQFLAIGDVHHPALTGFAFSKDYPEFTMAMADAFRSIVASGSYGEALERWNVSAIAIEEPYLNTEPLD